MVIEFQKDKGNGKLFYRHALSLWRIMIIEIYRKDCQGRNDENQINCLPFTVCTWHLKILGGRLTSAFISLQFQLNIQSDKPAGMTDM